MLRHPMSPAPRAGASHPPVPHRRFPRLVASVVVAGLVVGACSGDDDASDPTVTTAAGSGDSVAPATTSDESAPTTALSGEGLAVGVLAPPPGLIATLFQAQVRGIEAARADIAGGGGVLGGPFDVTQAVAPLGSTEADVAADVVAGGARALIGPAGSDAAAALLPELERLGAVSCSASATLPGLTFAQEQPALFRTAVPDDVVTAYLTQQIVARREEQAPGAPWRVAIVARSDAYGLSVGNGLAALLQAAGFAPSVIGYNPRRVVFDQTAAQTAAAAPDLTVLVSLEEGGNLLRSLVGAGIAPSSMIGLDGFFAPRLGAIAGGSDPSSVDGFTVLGTTGNRAFLTRLIDDDPNGQVAFAAQAYDCAIVLALATEQVEAGGSANLTAAVRDVTGGGIACTTYADCLDKLRAGEDIDYDGPSGRLAIDESGDPTSVRFTTGRLEGGQLVEVTSTDIDLAALDRQAAAYAAAAFITQLQQALRFLGFYDGPIDGLSSDELTAAIAAFQTSVGLPATGVVDAATEAALRAALGEYGDLLSSSTLGLQQLLTELGFYSGPLDGVWSPELTAAIRALQVELGVPPTGVIDAATIRAAYERGLLDGASGATTTTTAPTATTAPPTTAPPTTVPPTVPPATTTPETVPPTAPPTTIPPPAELDDLFRTLQADPRYSVFVDLLIAAGFTEDTEVIGPLTVFAPTNDAFADVDPAVLEQLRNDPEALRQVLSYHVVEGRLSAVELVGELVTVNGAVVVAAGSGATLTVGGAPVVDPDVEASNGVIHGVSAVLLPNIVPL
jgi:branched-chain amino acid transport system substrate-binding protein